MNVGRSRPLAPSVLESWEAGGLGGSSALGCHSAFRISHSALSSPLPAVCGAGSLSVFDVGNLGRWPGEGRRFCFDPLPLWRNSQRRIV